MLAPAVVQQGAAVSRLVHAQLIEQVLEHPGVDAVDGGVQLDGVADLGAAVAVAEHPVGDEVVGRGLDAVDGVLGVVVALADLHGGHPESIRGGRGECRSPGGPDGHERWAQAANRRN